MRIQSCNVAINMVSFNELLGPKHDVPVFALPDSMTSDTILNRENLRKAETRSLIIRVATT